MQSGTSSPSSPLSRPSCAPVDKTDLTEFFDAEAEENERHWRELMSLPVAERVRRRKAVAGVQLVGRPEEARQVTPEGDHLLWARARTNWSDFKEGEPLVLHKPDKTWGIRCNLYGFDGDDLILSFSSYTWNGITSAYATEGLDTYFGESLVLDKELVDLRNFVFYPFLAQLDSSPSYWQQALVNRRPAPTFRNRDACRQALENTVRELHLQLTAAQKEAVLNSMSAEDYYLIQGPPGTGKSFVLALIILMELEFWGRKVIVIGPNHLAVNNTLEQVLKLAPWHRNLLKVGQSYYAPQARVEYGGELHGIENSNRITSQSLTAFQSSYLAGMTPHALYTRRAGGLTCDTLIIDEAGQMPVPLGLMGMLKADKVILAGDHKQLSPIIVSDAVAAPLKSSIFERLMTPDNCTLLDLSFRMCQTICDFVSGLFYDGAVAAFHSEGSGLVRSADPLYDFGVPVVRHQVDDDGKQASEKEAAWIVEVVEGFLDRGLSPSDLAVVCPFRAQAAAVRRAIRKHPGLADKAQLIAADTVDKMQGQEREVILYSLTSGDPAYMQEMAEFLYQPNKMNVAFSRARSKLILAGNFRQLAQLDLPDYPHLQMMLDSPLVKTV